MVDEALTTYKLHFAQFPKTSTLMVPATHMRALIAEIERLRAAAAGAGTGAIAGAASPKQSETP